MDSFILYNMDDILNKFNIITNKCLTSTPLFCNINSNILDNYASIIVNNTNDIKLKINIINKLLIIYPKKINLCLNMAHIYDIHNDSLNSLVWHFNAYNIDPFHAGNFNYLIKKLFSLDMHEKIIEICDNNGTIDHFNDDIDIMYIYVKCKASRRYYNKGLANLFKIFKIFKQKQSLHIPFDTIKLFDIYKDIGNLLNELCDHANSIKYLNIALIDYDTFNLPNNLYKHSIRQTALFNNLYFFNDNKLFYENVLKINDYFPMKDMDKTQMQYLNQKKTLMQKNQYTEPMRIGYISSDITRHPVANFIIPILKYHNKDKFEIFIYANLSELDILDIFKTFNCKILYIKTKNDQEVADMIMKHKIDILIDLNGLTNSTRLSVFALNPAPIQINYLGYPNTTGLKSTHYRITDYIADNKNSTQLYSETLLRLPKCFLLYDNMLYEYKAVTYQQKTPDSDIILGALNNECKTNKHVLYAWREILKKCPTAKIMIKLSSFDNNEERKKFYLRHLETTEDRIIIINKAYDDTYFELFKTIDILLDTFPYSGTTTTCNALWNSTPVVTLYNKDCHAQNVSASILFNANLSELIAFTMDEYINLVQQLVHNLERIAEYKNTIHAKFEKSMDARSFMNDYEGLLQNTYHKYYTNIDLVESIPSTVDFKQFKSKIKKNHARFTSEIEHLNIVLADTTQTEINIF